MVSRRLERRVRSDFSPTEAEAVLARLGTLQLRLDRSPEETERIQGAVLLLAAGDSERFIDAAASAELDWRDVLLWSGLGEESWPERLNAEFG
jgi:hypothetical protein